MTLVGGFLVADPLEGVIHEADRERREHLFGVGGLHVLLDLGPDIVDLVPELLDALRLLAIPVRDLLIAVLVDGHVFAVLSLDLLLVLVLGGYPRHEIAHGRPQ